MTRDQKIYRCSYWVACGVLALVFSAGYHKLIYPEEFALSVYRFHLLPDYMVNLVALWIPWLEVVCVIGLLFIPKLRPAVLWIVLGLLVVFSLGIIINLLRGTAFGCGCFSRSAVAKPMNWMSVGRNAVLIFLAGMALWGHKKSRQDAGNSD